MWKCDGMGGFLRVEVEFGLILVIYDWYEFDIFSVVIDFDKQGGLNEGLDFVLCISEMLLLFLWVGFVCVLDLVIVGQFCVVRVGGDN